MPAAEDAAGASAAAPAAAVLTPARVEDELAEMLGDDFRLDADGDGVGCES